MVREKLPPNGKHSSKPLIRQAKAQIEARAADRDAREKADVDAKMRAREEKTSRTGKKPRGNGRGVPAVPLAVVGISP
jgi:hypothetical protein